MIKKDLNPTKKKLGFSEWLEILVFAFSTIHLTFLLLSLFNVFRPDVMTRESFSYVVAFILLAVCLLLFLSLMLTEKFGKIKMPNWLKCVLYFGFFIFTNVYYAIGAFENMWFMIVFFIFLSFVVNIVSLSLFYNLQKTDNGIIKTNNGFVAFFTFCASVTAITLINIILSSINILLNSAATTTLFIAYISAAILVSLSMSVIFYMSLTKTKKIINACLIKSNK